MSPEMESPLTGATLGDYEVLETIGKGGMGIVYRAKQLSLDRPVAMKVLPPEFCRDEEYVNRFLREARAAANLNHANIIQIIDAGVLDEIYFLVMELVDGKNLGQIVRERGALREYDALSIIYQVSQALAYAHNLGIVHRDVKPENIMVTTRRAVKVGDLGLARRNRSKSDLALTSESSALGTPHYISPEQIRGAKDVDGRSDIYSLGVTLDYLLRGHPAFVGSTAAEIMAQQLSDDLPPLRPYNPEITHATLELLSGMTIKDRDERIRDMADVTAAIGGMLGYEAETVSRALARTLHQPATAKQASDPWAKVLYRGMHLFKFGIAVVLGLLLALLGQTAWNHFRPKPPASGSTAGPEPEEPAAKSLWDARAGQLMDGRARIAGPEHWQTLTISAVDGSSLHTGKIRDTGDEMKPGPHLLFRRMSRFVGLFVLSMKKDPQYGGTTSGLLRVRFDTVPGMDTPDGFVETIRRCEQAILRLTRKVVIRDSDEFTIEAHGLRKPWGMQTPEWPSEIKTHFNAIAAASLKPAQFALFDKIFGNEEIRRSIAPGCQQMHQETNWDGASGHLNLPWEEPGARGDSDRDPERLSSAPGTEDPFRFSGSKNDLEFIEVDVLADLRAYAELVQGGNKLPPHHGWIIYVADGAGGIIFNSSWEAAGPTLILTMKKEGGAGQPSPAP